MFVADKLSLKSVVGKQRYSKHRADAKEVPQHSVLYADDRRVMCITDRGYSLIAYSSCM